MRQQAGTSWTIPAAVYGPMESWDFGTADRAIAETATTIADAAAVSAALPAIAVDANPVRDQLASATTLSELTKIGDTAQAQRATAEELAATIGKADNVNPIDAIGLVGTDVDAMSSKATDSVATLDLSSADSETAAIDSALKGATMTGLVRILIALAFAAVVTFAIWRRRRGDGNAVDGQGSDLGDSGELPRATADPVPGLASVSLEDQPTAS